MALTVKGQPMGAAQQATANRLLRVANNLGAGSIAAEACIFDAIYESSIGVNNGWDAGNPTYGGVLAGSIQFFGHFGGASSAAVTNAQATSFFQGGNGYQGGGAIALARTNSDVAYIGSQVTAAVPFNSQGYSTQYLSQGFPFSSVIAEAKAIVAAYGGGTLKGGVAGVGGSGTVANGSKASTYAFQIGGPNNPDEDFWTGTNRLAQAVAWYFFSNGEYLYFLDGQEMIAQTPALRLDRIRDAARFFQGQGSLTWDDTSYQYVASHRRKFRVQRKTSLAMVTSPTQATLQVICGIDEIRGGDVIELSSFGPGDGRWIVGDCRRSVFNVYSELRLVPPISPITEAIAAGTTGRNQATPGNLGTPGGGTVSPSGSQDVDAFIAKGVEIGNQNMPYVWGGGHGTIGVPNGGGFDCSGYVSACAGAAGWLSTPLSSGGFESWGDPGPGKLLTIWCNADHVYAEIKVPGTNIKRIDTVPDSSGPGAKDGPHVRFQWPGPEGTSGFTPRHWKGA